MSRSVGGVRQRLLGGLGITLVMAAVVMGGVRAVADAGERTESVAPSDPVDVDFALQGEFLGRLPSTVGTYDFGVQVVADGEGKFSARSYSGGLPGNGWDGYPPVVWNGQRAQDIVVLESNQGRLQVDRQGATWFSAEGTEVGYLPKVVRRSATMGEQPPAGATILFDGTDVSAFEKASMTPDSLLLAGATTKASFGDFRLHLEFRTPYMPAARGQGRGNSGVYIQQRYEVQILDSFGLAPVANGCGALYKQQEPMLNMCFPPHSWQTYDIDFQAPRWDPCGNKLCPARITVWHNGVRIHDHYPVAAKTGAGQPEGPEDRPLLLQFHGNPVHYRNVWLVAHPQSESGRWSACESDPFRWLDDHAARRGLRLVPRRWDGPLGTRRGAW